MALHAEQTSLRGSRSAETAPMWRQVGQIIGMSMSRDSNVAGVVSSRAVSAHKLGAPLSFAIPTAHEDAQISDDIWTRAPHTQEFFDLEHLIPKQSLKLDPVAVQLNPDTPKNARAGNLLLCKKPLRVKGLKVFNNGFNSWKGKHYDTAIAELVSEKTLRSATVTSAHIIGALCLGYLAMVAEFGYAVVLMESGLFIGREMDSRARLLLGR